MWFHICIIGFSRWFEIGVKRGRVSNCPERGCWMLRSSSLRTGFARSGTGWVLELSLQIRQ